MAEGSHPQSARRPSGRSLACAQASEQSSTSVVECRKNTKHVQFELAAA